MYNGNEFEYIVMWDENENDFKATNGKENYGSNFQYLSCCDEIEVIGNIYDNTWIGSVIGGIYMTVLINTLVVCGITLTILVSLLFATLIIGGIVGIIKYMIDEIKEQ